MCKQAAQVLVIFEPPCNFKYTERHILDTLPKSPFQRSISLARSITSATEVIYQLRKKAAINSDLSLELRLVAITTEHSRTHRDQWA